MLRTSLDRHPEIVALTEVFNPDWLPDADFHEDTPPPAILNDHVFCEYPPEIGAVGFTLHRSDARVVNWPHLWRRLEGDEQLSVISLRRENLLRRYLSFQIMVDPASDPQQPMVFRPEVLLAEFQRREAEAAAFDRRFAGHPLLPVSYEQLCTDYQPTVARIQAFLGVPARRLAPGTQQTGPRRLCDWIANFDELVRIFAATRWAWFFRDETC
jgi:hypothetical protein